MPQDHDALRKLGRGGAGNYVPSKQVDEADKDLEAQRQNLPIDPPPRTSSSSAAAAVTHAAPVRAGRGGAGNFVDPAKTAREEEQLASETAAAVASNFKKQPHRAAWSGRGGAGNFNSDGAVAEQANRGTEDEEKGRVAELDKKVKEAVEGALKLPEKVHYNPNQDEI